VPQRIGPSVRLLHEKERRPKMQRALNIGCALGIILVPAFGLLDCIVAPHQLHSLLSIRFICSVNLLALFFLNRSHFGEKHANYLAIYGAASVAVSIAMMTYVLGGPKSSYYAGINLAVIVAGLITPMTVLEGLITCLAIYLSYVLSSLPFLHGDNIEYFTNNSFFMLATMIVVLIGFRLKERWALQEIEQRLELMDTRSQLEDYAKNLEEKVREQTLNIIQALAYAIEAKDLYTRGHSDRVKNYALALAQRLGLSEHDILQISNAAILHDIGKVKISGHIIQKPNPLTEDEYSDMKTHPALGELIVDGISFLADAKLLIRHHHERWDGKGYPDGLRGEDIPLGARIIAVADIYDALTFHRPYREGTSPDAAIHYLREEKEKSLDPNLVEAFVELIHDTHGVIPRL
jgi:HD-GYP domain-containing protein (c-di-GMP phosphodiesterase class II)